MTNEKITNAEGDGANGKSFIDITPFNISVIFDNLSSAFNFSLQNLSTTLCKN